MQIVMNKVQYKIALELAMQEAAREEIRKQVQDQFPDNMVTIPSCNISLTDDVFPQFNVDGMEVVWV